MATTEELILTRYFKNLVDAIVSPGPVAIDLFSAGMIAGEARDEATNEHVSKNTRASNLVSAVLAAVKSSPQFFSSFLNVMKRHPPGNLVAERMEREYRKLIALSAAHCAMYKGLVAVLLRVLTGGEPAEEHVESSYKQLRKRDIRKWSEIFHMGISLALSL